MTTKADHAVDRAADALDTFVRQARSEGGVKAKVAANLEDDPAFLRKLKPSLIAARAKGENPPMETGTQVETPPPAEPRRTPQQPKGGGPNPLLVIGAALALGYALAKLIDWRSHAHPRI